MQRIMFLALVLLAGCAAGERVITPVEAARVVNLTLLPPLSSLSSVGGIKMETMFLVRSDGTVADVRIVGSSGDPAWDLAAADSMRLWRFVLDSPDTSRESQWVRTTVIVQMQEPIVMTLGELSAETRAKADSLYVLLQRGVDFHVLAGEVHEGTSSSCKWYLGSVNIARYPRHIREALQSLAVNEFTPPIRTDGRYSIFQRLESTPR